MERRTLSIDRLPIVVDGPIVVVDVLRAFTTAAWVLERGASALFLAATDEEALALQQRLGADAVAIKDGELADGFDLGNSPGQVRAANLAGRPVVQRTMNGTTAVHAAMHAPLVLCASLVNASATAQALLARRTDVVTYLITGQGGEASEDLACADHIHALVQGDPPPGDTADRVRSSPAADDLRCAILRGYRGVAADDVELACTIDAVGFAMVAEKEGGGVRVRSISTDGPLRCQGD